MIARLHICCPLFCKQRVNQKKCKWCDKNPLKSACLDQMLTKYKNSNPIFRQHFKLPLLWKFWKRSGKRNYDFIGLQIRANPLNEIVLKLNCATDDRQWKYYQRQKRHKQCTRKVNGKTTHWNQLREYQSVCPHLHMNTHTHNKLVWETTSYSNWFYSSLMCNESILRILNSSRDDLTQLKCK